MSKRTFWIFIVLFFSAFGIGVTGAEAAVLLISPSSGSHGVGDNFPVRVLVSSPDAQMNAASGVVSFPSDKLAVISLSKTGSIINLWTQEPSFDNNAGTVNFEGIVLNPGFQGTGGQVITVNFRVKSTGAAPVNFNSGSVLANNGQGTNILSGFTNATFNLTPAAKGQEAGQSTTPSETSPFAPQISSLTHPDPNKWYNNNNPKFTWTVPSGVTDVRLLYDKFPQSIPAVIYSPPISEKNLENIPDGVWYFHVQFRDSNGWGSVAHFRFQIDIAPPDPMNIRFVDISDTTNPTPTVLFDTADAGSGIDYYKVKIGDRDFIVISANTVKSNPYTLPVTSPGKQTLLVQAFDRAGNYETALSNFTISPLPAPIITDFPSAIQPSDVFAVNGSTQPLSKVTVWLEKNGSKKTFTGLSDASGLFTISGNGSTLEAGSYELWVEATDARGAKTLASEKHGVVVGSSYLLRIGSYAINILTVLVSVIALIALLGFMFWYFWRKVIGVKRRVRKESQDASRIIHRKFTELREKLRRHVKSLEQAETKRELTLEEKKILSELKSEIDRVEEVVEKNLEDIKRDLN